jgi:hypothetical protein
MPIVRPAVDTYSGGWGLRLILPQDVQKTTKEHSRPAQLFFGLWNLPTPYRLNAMANEQGPPVFGITTVSSETVARDDFPESGRAGPSTRKVADHEDMSKMRCQA